MRRPTLEEQALRSKTKLLCARTFSLLASSYYCEQTKPGARGGTYCIAENRKAFVTLQPCRALVQSGHSTVEKPSDKSSRLSDSSIGPCRLAGDGRYFLLG